MIFLNALFTRSDICISFFRVQHSEKNMIFLVQNQYKNIFQNESYELFSRLNNSPFKNKR